MLRPKRLLRSLTSLQRIQLAAALFLVLSSAGAQAALFQHLDASVAGSLIDDGGVITWLDQSGNGNNAIDTGLGGLISEPSTGFPTGLTGVDFDASSSRAQMQLLDSAGAAAVLDQSVPEADGYSMLLVVESQSGSDWNDLIGNTSAVGNAAQFVMRYGGSGGRLQAGVSGTIQNNTAGQTNGYVPGVPMVLGVNYDPVSQVATLASSLFGYSQDFGGRAPGDFTNAGSALFLGSNVNTTRFFDGQIGEVKIYDAALTSEEFATEIEALHQKWTRNPDGTLEIVIDRSTGDVSLISPGSIPVELVGLSLFSGSGSLDPSDWNSITNTYDSDSGDNSVDADDEWLLLSEQTTDLSEATLGTTALAGGQTVDLGKAFALGGAEDITAEFADPVTEEVVTLTVSYVGEAPADLLPGDFNEDGVVDAGDYTVYRNALGQDVSLPNETVSIGRVTEDDLATWTANYGSAAASGEAGAVPEPTGAVLALFGLVGMAYAARQRTTTGPLALVGLALLSGPASAAVTIDRDYLLGEDGAIAGLVEGASVGAAVGAGNTAAPDTTIDWAGSTGTNSIVVLENRAGASGPTYADVSARPGASAGDLGVAFDGSTYLVSEHGDRTAPTGGGLGSPQEAVLPLGSNYGGLRNRGFQFWVNPSNSEAGARQDILNDTYQFGVHITADNNWGMTWGALDAVTTTGEVVESTTAVAFNEWSHVMHWSNNDNVQGFIGGAMFVNGIAVATRGFGAGEVWQIATPDDASRDLTVGATLDQTPNFTGTVDNLQMFISGGTDDALGEFNLGTDNDFVVQAMAGIPDGDADLDGDVDDADVAIFAENWLAVQDIDPREDVIAIMGDLVSRQTLADFNYDGRTDYADWFILRNAHPDGDSLSLARALAGVPEPASTALLAVAGLAAWASRRRG